MTVHIIRLEQVESTNAHAKTLVSIAPEEPQLIVAASQTGGRGQYGRSFSSPPGGLYFSVLLQPELPAHQLPLITLAVGVACAHYLDQEVLLPAQLKWPNDVYCAGRKLGGILCESILDKNQPYTIIGVGLNANTSVIEYPEEVQPILTTIREQTGGFIDLGSALLQLVDRIFRAVELLKEDQQEMLRLWQQRDYLYNRRLRYVTERLDLTGTGMGISENGCYQMVDNHDNVHEIIGGQVRPLTSGTPF